MLFLKREVNKEDLFEFSMVPLIDPVSKQTSTPKHVTVGQDEEIYLVSLSNQHISFTYEMPRYFTLVVAGKFVFFYVINHTDLCETSEDVTKLIYVKGIKVPVKLEKKTKELKQLIKDSLLVYYGDYTINAIILDPIETVQYYVRMNDGKLYYE